MLKKILFLLSALFFCMNIFSGEVVQQKLEWFSYNIPQEIECKIISYCDLADFGNCKLVCKHFNNFDLDTLICTTHRQAKHECSSIHLSDLTKDYDRCTYILHCIANRKNEKYPLEFNSTSEKNLFNMIYFLHKQNREQLIETAHPAVKPKPFTDETRRNYYQYTESNANSMLLKAINKNKAIRIKQILQSSNQYIKRIIPTLSCSIINVIITIVQSDKSTIEGQNMIEQLLSAANDTNTKKPHDIWQDIVLTLCRNNYEHKNALINFLLSEKFNYLNPYFSANFYTEKRGFLSFCNENDFDLISDRCDKNASFNISIIEPLDALSTIEDFNLSIKIVQWLISKNCKFPQDHNKVVKKAYKSGNINLVKLLIQKGMSYYKVISTICKKNDINLATWILDNCNEDGKFKYNDKFMHAACYYLNVEMVQLLITKEKIVNFYKSFDYSKNYPGLTPLFEIILLQGANKTPELSYKQETYNDACCKMIKLFLENGFDMNEQIKDTQSYKYGDTTYFSCYIKRNAQLTQIFQNHNATQHVETNNNLKQSTNNNLFYILFPVSFLIAIILVKLLFIPKLL